MVFTNLAPNTQADDARLAWKILMQPWKWKHGTAIAEVEEKIASIIGVKNAVSFESGRTSLYTILKALDISAGDEVVLQAFTCVAVPDPVLWADATPIYIDCDQTLNMSPIDLEKKITPKAKALIIQHTFGVPSNLNALVAIAKKHNLFVIEDCAHALGARYADRPVGSFGDASFFSFGRDKTISSVFGGMVVTSNDQLAEKIRATQNSYPTPGLFWIKQQLRHPALMHFAKKTYRYGGSVLIALLKATHLTSRAVYPIEKTGGRPHFTGKKLANAMALLALHQLKKLDTFNTHRNQLAALYERELAPLGINHQLTKQPTDQVTIQPAWLRFTIWTDKVDAIKIACRKQGIFLGDWYDTGIAPRGVDYPLIGYKPETCPVAEQIARDTVNLPTDINTSEADARRIIEIIKSVYARS
jgi:perosamine synthetase